MIHMNTSNVSCQGIHLLLTYEYRFGRYITSAPIVSEKILSIAALLATYTLPDAQRPVKQIMRFIVDGKYLPYNDRLATGTGYQSFNDNELQILFIFATYLIEQVPKAHLSRMERYFGKRRG